MHMAADLTCTNTLNGSEQYNSSFAMLYCEIIFGSETDHISLPSCCFCSFYRLDLLKSPRLSRFESDQDEIWHDFSSKLPID